MKAIRKFLAITLGLACMASGSACAFTLPSGSQTGAQSSVQSSSEEESQGSALLDFKVTADGGSYAVTGIGQETGEDIVIPSSYQGKPVKEIAESAFARNATVKSVVIPSSVEKIATTAFLQCTALERVLLNEGVKELGERAFGNCAALKEISLPNTLTTFGNSIFFGCDAMELTEKNGGYYIGNQENPYVIFVKVKDTTLVDCIIENQCKFLYDKCFYNCEKLESISMPNSVVQIGAKAFGGCTSLYGPILSDNIHTIGEFAFEKCTGLQLITLGANIKKIERFAFYSCKLSHVYYKGTKEDRAEIEVNSGQNGKLNMNDAANGAKWHFEAE